MKFSTRAFLMACILTGQVGYADPGHPDLKVEKNIEGSLKESLELLEKIKSTELGQVKPQAVAIPDYAPAYYTFESLVKKQVGSYFKALAQIHREILEVYSQLAGARQWALEEQSRGDKNGKFTRAYYQEVKRLIPPLNSKINVTYRNALKQLFSLGGHLQIPVDRKFLSKDYKNQFLNRISWRVINEGVWSVCQTSICVEELAADVLDFMQQAMVLNRGFDLLNFNRLTVGAVQKEGHRVNVVTNAFASAAAELIRSGLKTNVEQNFLETVSDSIGVAAKKTGGVVTGALIAPVFVIEKSLNMVHQLLTALPSKMRLKLSVSGIRLLKYSDIQEGVRDEIIGFARLKPMAIAYSKSAETIRDESIRRGKAIGLVIDANNYVAEYKRLENIRREAENQKMAEELRIANEKEEAQKKLREEAEAKAKEEARILEEERIAKQKKKEEAERLLRGASKERRALYEQFGEIVLTSAEGFVGGCRPSQVQTLGIRICGQFEEDFISFIISQKIHENKHADLEKIYQVYKRVLENRLTWSKKRVELLKGNIHSGFSKLHNNIVSEVEESELESVSYPVLVLHAFVYNRHELGEKVRENALNLGTSVTLGINNYNLARETVLGDTQTNWLKVTHDSGKAVRLDISNPQIILKYHCPSIVVLHQNPEFADIFMGQCSTIEPKIISGHNDAYSGAFNFSTIYVREILYSNGVKKINSTYIGHLTPVIIE